MRIFWTAVHRKSTPHFRLHSFTNPSRLLRARLPLCFLSTSIEHEKSGLLQRPGTNGQAACDDGHRPCKLQGAKPKSSPARGSRWHNAWGLGAVIVPVVQWDRGQVHKAASSPTFSVRSPAARREQAAPYAQHHRDVLLEGGRGRTEPPTGCGRETPSGLFQNFCLPTDSA